MFVKLRLKNKGDFSTQSGWYSSSTENGAGQSYVYSFYYEYILDEDIISKDRGEEMFIRAIRAF